jgi:predicted DNA repair protein MutK
MAGSSLLALIDDIATLLDDVGVLTKVAASKTAGVIGDDLAVNAEQVAGIRAERELPVVWAVAKGSLVNKAILVPTALAISAFVPMLITPLLMVGGAFLCFEGVEKLVHSLAAHDEDAHAQQLMAAAEAGPVDLAAFEKDKIKGAVRTDFVLSAEIITITLGAVADAEFAVQVLVLIGTAILMTAGVYGVVAGIVKLDDAGLHLSRATGAHAFARFERAFGRGILRAAPWLMKGLSIAGTAAMFLVGGGIVAHGLGPVHRAGEAVARATKLDGLGTILWNTGFGVLVGALVFGGVALVARLRKPRASKTS